jgi:hypothetical protein
MFYKALALHLADVERRPVCVITPGYLSFAAFYCDSKNHYIDAPQNQHFYDGKGKRIDLECGSYGEIKWKWGEALLINLVRQLLMEKIHHCLAIWTGLFDEKV